MVGMVTEDVGVSKVGTTHMGKSTREGNVTCFTIGKLKVNEGIKESSIGWRTVYVTILCDISGIEVIIETETTYSRVNTIIVNRCIL